MKEYSYPSAYAKLSGNADNPGLQGIAYFYPAPFGGVLIEVEVYGLPHQNIPPYSQFYALHIHENLSLIHI